VGVMRTFYSAISVNSDCADEIWLECSENGGRRVSDSGVNELGG